MNRRDEAPRRVDLPEVGFFELRLVRNGPFVAAQIVNESGQWSAIIDGVHCGDPDEDPAAAKGVFDVWHRGRRITKAEHDYRLALKSWALAQPKADHPAANPRKPIDLRNHRSLF